MPYLKSQLVYDYEIWYNAILRASHCNFARNSQCNVQRSATEINADSLNIL